MIPERTGEALVEVLHPDCKLVWDADHSLISITMRGTRHEMIDIWAKRSIEIRQEWPSDKPLCLLLDLRDGEATQYSQVRAKEIASVRPELTTYFAMVVKRSLSAQLISLIFRGLGLTGSKVRFFFTPQEARLWIEKSVSKLKIPSLPA